MQLDHSRLSALSLSSLSDAVTELPALPASELSEHDVLVTVDMLNGFCRTGNLSSPRALALIDPLRTLTGAFPGKRVYLCDKHTADSAEFSVFPPHCTDNIEIMVVDELIDFADSHPVYKNSTNGFFSFVRDFQIDKQTKHVIIVGVCTDLCVLQFALTMQAYFTEFNRPVRVSVLTDHVDTYDAPGHPADFYNLAALSLLKTSGVALYRTIDFPAK